MGLFKRIRRHLIKSILSLKNTHENVFLTAIASSSTLTWFTYQIRPSLCIFGLTCSLSSSYTGAPQSVFFLSPNGGDTTLAVLSTGLISSSSSPPTFAPGSPYAFLGFCCFSSLPSNLQRLLSHLWLNILGIFSVTWLGEGECVCFSICKTLSPGHPSTYHITYLLTNPCGSSLLLTPSPCLCFFSLLVALGSFEATRQPRSPFFFLN